MKVFLSIVSLSICLLSFGQRDYIYGVAIDSTSAEEMEDVHIKNVNAGLVTSSNASGKFKIPAKTGDTLVLSNVGYKTLAWVVKESWFNEETVTFYLPMKTFYLEEVVIGKHPSYEDFKEELATMDVEDSSFQVYGVPKVVITEMDRLNGSLNVRGPFSAIHNRFSKRAKEQRKVRTLLQEQGTSNKAREKFTRDWVAKSTKLEGDKLTSFIEYCDFSPQYLAETSEYLIYEDMMALLPTFLEAYEDRY